MEKLGPFADKVRNPAKVTNFISKLYSLLDVR